MTQIQTTTLTIADSLRKMEPEFRLALPNHIPSERFTRIAISAVNSNPDLLRADVDKRSLYAACMKAAQDGLVIDGREAALVTFKNKEGNTTASYIPMIAGILKKMRNSGEISNVGYGLVYKNEYDQGKFKYIKGDNESLEHTPILFEEKGALIGVYAVVTLRDGAKVREFMDMKQIEKVRNVSRSKNGPWATWFEEMCVKSVLRKVSKLCPMSSDLDALFKSEDEEEVAAQQEAVDVTPAPQPETPEKPKRTKAADKVKAAVADQHIESTSERVPEVVKETPQETEHVVVEEEDLPI